MGTTEADFIDKISLLSERIPELLDHLETEEATKNALILPFISALGYDVFDPTEVTPEYTADVGVKKGEKVDYAIARNGEIIFLVECKKIGTNLDKAAIHQLFRYFAVTKARIAILANGIEYRFFSDLEEPNKMDLMPFLTLNLTERREGLLREINKLSKGTFDLEHVLNSANELKLLGQIRSLLSQQTTAPSEELLRFFHASTCGGRFTSQAREEFTAIFQRAFRQFLAEETSARLRAALSTGEPSAQATGDGASGPEEASPELEASEEEDSIVTTQDEIEGYHIVKAILSRDTDPHRIHYRDNLSYMAILLDDNNRKTICRLWFNRRQKYLGLFDDDKRETRVPIDDLTEIYKYDTHLKVTVLKFDEAQDGLN